MGMTIAQKIFKTHLRDQPFEDISVLNLDRVFCHEITTPTAILDLIARNKDRVYDSDKIKAVIDHVTPAKDSKTAMQGKILREWARRQNIKDFFDIGSNGVCHALFPEQGFVLPGSTIIMGDSHTCTYGAFGTFAAGVGTTDLEVGILKGVCAFRKPHTFKINIIGSIPKGVYAKDIILKVIQTIGMNGATDMIIEFTGNIVDEMNMDQRMTLSNMAIEAGATCGICLPDMNTIEYLWEFIKKDYSSKQEALENFSKFRSDENAVYEKEITIEVSNLEPLTTFGYKPDNVKTVSQMKGTKVDQVYIGSCTNGRFEDLQIAAKILKGRTLNKNIRGIVSPATPKIFSLALEKGIIKIFMDAGFCITNPTCGACLGMSNGVLAKGEVAAATTNRNFNGRMGKGGMVHLVSPATAAATAIKGELSNPDAL